MQDTERTLVILKPECIDNCITGSVLKFFDDVGIRSIAMRQLTATPEQMRIHYAEVIERVGETVGADIIKRMTRGPIIAIVYQGPSIVKNIRGIVGATDPKQALPGTIRERFGSSVQYNIIHASDSITSAQKEIELWFPELIPRVSSEQYITGC